MDLLTAYQTAGLQPVRVNENEYCGPCIHCGGVDRFRMWIDSGRWWCRRCEEKGDLIDFVQWKYDCNYMKALEIIDAKPAGHQLTGSKQPTQARQAAPEAKDETRKVAYVYQKSKVDYKAIQRYFSARGLDVSDSMIKEMGIRFNEYQGQKAVIVPIRTPGGKIVQVQRILVDAYYQKQDKRFTGRYSGDRGLLIRRDPARLLILEGIEDVITLYIHSNCNASLLCCYGTAGFSRVSSFIDGFQRVACLLDNDSNGAGLKAAERLPARVKLLMPTLEPGLDANASLMQGRLSDWLRSIEPVRAGKSQK